MKRINGLGYILAMTAMSLTLTAEAATVRVTGGTLYLGNKLSATNFVLGSAATLVGNGEVRAPATLAGTVSPGSSAADIGTLSFSDWVAFDSGTYICYAATATSLDKISVTGNVTGAGTVQMTRAAGVAPLRQVIIKGGAASDYTSFTVSPSTEWALGQANALDLVVSYGQLPPAPQNIAASDGTYASKVALSWSVASDASGYQVWRNTANDSSSATQIGASSGLAYDDASASVGTLYYYWIKATNTIGVSGFSASASGWRASISQGVCADYDGDRKADPAVYDEATGTWKVKLSSAGYYLVITTVNDLGGPGYASVAADYDGDRKADPAVYQETTGTWIVLLSSMEYALPIELPSLLGGPGYSGMPADYDGDQLADPGVYQREQGDWQVLLSSAGYSSITLLGLLGGTGYMAVASDYDGDQRADPAVYGESNGVWVFKISSANYLMIALAQTLGGTGYLPVPADYDGDGLADPAVRSTTDNEWIVMLSSAGYTIVPVTLSFE